MTSTPLFPSVLGAEFTALHPCLKQVHSGESLKLRGTVAVDRGRSLVARAMGAIASLPPAATSARIEVQIESSDKGERWIRVFATSHTMVSTL